MHHLPYIVIPTEAEESLNAALKGIPPSSQCLLGRNDIKLAVH